MKKYPLVIVGAYFSLLIAAKASGIVINTTPSMPEGVYMRGHGLPRRGDIVALCLPEPYQSFGLARFYIAKGHTCQKSESLIKQVVALPGDTVVLGDHDMQVNHVTYPYPTADHDGAGRILFHPPRGVYYHTTGYWLIGTHAANSWDSRYWGPLDKTMILSVLKPVWTV